MKTKYLLIIALLLTTINSFAQESDKVVTIVASGSGRTKDEAKQIALRNAIEQAFGTFISSNTEILNDNLVKDEIVSVSNGNIQKFEVLSEANIPDGSFATTLKAAVSITKLTSFVESKGVTVEFKGSLFAFNINQQVLNEKNEIKAIYDLINVVKILAANSFDYNLKSENPTSLDKDNTKWNIKLEVSIIANKNLNTLSGYVFNTLKGISLPKTDQESYKSLSKKLYPMSMSIGKNDFDHFNFRTSKTIDLIDSMLNIISKNALNFQISNGINFIRLNDEDYNDYYSKIKNLFVYNNESFYTFDLPNRNKLVTNSFGNLYSLNDVYESRFPFVLSLREKMNGEKNNVTYWNGREYIYIDIFSAIPGIIVSFDNFTNGKEFYKIEFNDVKTLSEINQIREYKVNTIIK